MNWQFLYSIINYGKKYWFSWKPNIPLSFNFYELNFPWLQEKFPHFTWPWRIFFSDHFVTCGDYVKVDIFKTHFKGSCMDYCSSKPIRCWVQALRADTSGRGLGIHLWIVWAWPLAIFIGEKRNSAYIPSHIKLGHPVLYSYSDKKLYSFAPSVDFVASGMPTSKNQHWQGRRYRPLNPKRPITRRSMSKNLEI